MRDSEKVYSKEELLNYLYKYGNIPVILFAKDKETLLDLLQQKQYKKTTDYLENILSSSNEGG